MYMYVSYVQEVNIFSSLKFPETKSQVKSIAGEKLSIRCTYRRPVFYRFIIVCCFFLLDYFFPHNMIRRMVKPTICIGENKGADQLRSNCKADQRLCFRNFSSS